MSQTEENKAADISDREIEQYLSDQSDWASLNRGNRVRSTGERDAKMDAMARPTLAARGAGLQQEELSRQMGPGRGRRPDPPEAGSMS